MSSVDGYVGYDSCVVAVGSESWWTYAGSNGASESPCCVEIRAYYTARA